MYYDYAYHEEEEGGLPRPRSTHLYLYLGYLGYALTH